jgi:hypothetical protein
LKAKSNKETITQDISDEEYFLYAYPEITWGDIYFKDALGNDINRIFLGWPE